MKAKTTYVIIGLLLFFIDLVLVIPVGNWLDTPTHEGIPMTLPQSIHNSTIGVFSIITILWWAPASVVGITAVCITEALNISIGFALFPTLITLWFQPRIIAFALNRIKKKSPNHGDPPNTHSPSAQGVGGR
jgi:hypothetical protein